MYFEFCLEDNLIAVLMLKSCNLNADVHLPEAAVVASLHGFAFLGIFLTLCCFNALNVPGTLFVKLMFSSDLVC